jgi:hypothetical protein
MAPRDRLSGAGLKPTRAAAVKSRGGERRVKKSRARPGAGRCRKDERKQILRRRVVNVSSAVETRGDHVLWDKPVRSLMTERAAAGV